MKDNLLEKIEALEQSLQANSEGLQNVYTEFQKFNFKECMAKIDAVNERLEHYERDKNVEEFDLDIQSFPMNIRINLKIKTNFGEITKSFDYPPAIEYQIGPRLAYAYENLLNMLYEEHEIRGGKFIGEEGAKDWFDNNEKTIINLEPSNSPRFNK